MKGNPAFIVDGFTEKNIIDKICPNRPIRRTDLNGKDVTLDKIAERLETYLRLFNNKYYPIIIIIDKEDRDQSCAEIIKYLKNKLDDAGFKNDDIRISIADRMIENWLIADTKIFNENDKPIKIDGINGSAVLKKKYGTYSKATDCLKIINDFCPETAYKNSESFKQFVDSIDSIDCAFTKFPR